MPESIKTDPSRRAFLKRMGVAGLAVGTPVVASFALNGCFGGGEIPNQVN